MAKIIKKKKRLWPGVIIFTAIFAIGLLFQLAPQRTGNINLKLNIYDFALAELSYKMLEVKIPEETVINNVYVPFSEKRNIIFPSQEIVIIIIALFIFLLGCLYEFFVVRERIIGKATTIEDLEIITDNGKERQEICQISKPFLDNSRKVHIIFLNSDKGCYSTIKNSDVEVVGNPGIALDEFYAKKIGKSEIQIYHNPNTESGLK